MKKITLTYIFFLLFIGYSFIYADGDFAQNLNEIPNNVSSSLGSNQNSISFPIEMLGKSFGGYYIIKNKDFDSIQGNYLSGYYYDSTYGFFELNWDTTGSNNVQIVYTSVSTDKCDGTTAYKFSGYARGVDFGSGADVGYIDFDYSSHSSDPLFQDTYVYYCSNDKKLHGYAYSTDLGFQSFEGISIDIFTQGKINTLLIKKDDPFFVNNFTDILNENYGGDTDGNDNIQGDIITKETGKETIFYITK